MRFFMKPKNAIFASDRIPAICNPECGNEMSGMSRECDGGEANRCGNVFLDEMSKYAVRDDKGQRLIGVLYVNNVPFHGFILDGDKLFADLRRMTPNEPGSHAAISLTKSATEINPNPAAGNV
jgi:hypothetical protein